MILRKTSELYGAKTDQEHIHTLVELNPKVPNRNHSISGSGLDCGPALGQMAENLVKANADFVVCACNTAHAYRQNMEKGCGKVPFVSMIDVTSYQVLLNLKKTGKQRKCGILGGVGCIEANLFQDSLSALGIEPITPCKES